MSIFGSLFTAVSGMQAQSDSISMISNNIANVSTVGFKRTDIAFSSLVTNPEYATSYSSGSVHSVQNSRIDQQGILQQSSSGTDIAISGSGFFIVKPSVTDPLAEYFYTRAGSFSEDSNGVLRNTAGFYLQGWPVDQNGNLPASQGDISSLVPVNISFIGGITLPTTNADLSINLQQGETQSSYPIASGFTADFTRGIIVYDSLGSGQDMDINFKKMETPTAIAAGTVDLSGITGLISDTPPFLTTDQFSVTVGAVGPTTITLNGTLADMLADINGIVDGNLDPVAYAQIDSNGCLTIKATNTGDDITLTDVTNTPLDPASLGMGVSPIVAAAPAVPTLLTPLAGVPNTEGWWTVDFRTPSGAIINAGAINFNGSGSLNAVEDLSGEVQIALNNIDWGNGSDPQDINFDISDFTQFAGEYNVISSTQNGAELGLRTGISIDDEGFVIAHFSNGQSSNIYKLAVATFANTNGLNERTGNVFRESDSSGNFNLREAGKGSAGKIAPGALEASNVDLAEEFSKMIVTQRAYSANTKVISTADQMTQELLKLR